MIGRDGDAADCGISRNQHQQRKADPRLFAFQSIFYSCTGQAMEQTAPTITRIGGELPVPHKITCLWIHPIRRCPTATREFGGGAVANASVPMHHDILPRANRASPARPAAVNGPSTLRRKPSGKREAATRYPRNAASLLPADQGAVPRSDQNACLTLISTP